MNTSRASSMLFGRVGRDAAAFFELWQHGMRSTMRMTLKTCFMEDVNIDSVPPGLREALHGVGLGHTLLPVNLFMTTEKESVLVATNDHWVTGRILNSRLHSTLALSCTYVRRQTAQDTFCRNPLGVDVARSS